MITLSAPASLTGAPLAELKRWLSISTTGEDELLTGLIAAALALCERFTGVMPFKCEVRQSFASPSSARSLGATPFIAPIEVEAVDGLQRRALAPEDYAIGITGEGTASFALLTAIAEPQVEIRYLAGLASEWPDIDEGLRQGVIRHAAHLYSEREQAEAAPLPASIAALWRPWRKLRL